VNENGPALHAGTREDWPAVSPLLVQVFHHAADPELERIKGSVVEPERTLLAEEDDAPWSRTRPRTPAI